MHLNLFLPFALLRLKPHIKSANSLTLNELTEFISSIIVILKEELSEGYISQQEMEDYLSLINFASERIFVHKPDYHEEVLKMTKSMIVLPSQLKDIIERQQREIEELTEQKDRILEEKDAIIAQLKEQLTAASLN